jgi:serine/threonine protein kinase
MGYFGYEYKTEGLYYFLEICKGGTLKDAILQKLSEFKVLNFFKQILDGMSYVHSQSNFKNI